MTAEPGFREPAARPAGLAWLLVATLPVIVNGFVGFKFMEALRSGGFAIVLVVPIATLGVGLVLVAILVGIAGLARRDAYGRMLARRWFPVAGLLTVGFAGGAAILPMRAALFPPPVVVELPPKVASVMLVLDHPMWQEPTQPSVGTCPLEPSGIVRFVTQEQLGTLLDAPVSATLGLSGRTADNRETTLALIATTLVASAVTSGARVAEVTGDDYVTWAGAVAITEIAADGMTGHATFVDLPIDGVPPSGWPRSLSGEITWSCS